MYDSQEVHDAADMRAVVESLGLLVKVSGDKITMRCPNPEHADRNPSCSGSIRKKVFHCFSCHCSGNVISLVEINKSLDYKGALEYVAQISGVPEKKPEKKRRRMPKISLTSEEQDFLGVHEIMVIYADGKIVEPNDEDYEEKIGSAKEVTRVRLLEKSIKEDYNATRAMLIDHLNEKMQDIMAYYEHCQNVLLGVWGGICYERGIVMKYDQEIVHFMIGNINDILPQIKTGQALYRKLHVPGKEQILPYDILIRGLKQRRMTILLRQLKKKTRGEETALEEAQLQANAVALEKAKEIIRL